MGKGNTFFSFFRIFAPIIWNVYKKNVNMTPTTERVFQIFKELNQIPRPSHHEERVADYLCQQFAERLGLTYKRDKENCVVISKPATPGHEGAEPIVLLNHMDMVCVGMSDPLNDPIQAYVEDGWMKARGTSLGADNGIGLSMALAVLESNDIVHGPMEVITTTNEEDGMSGASQLSSDFLRGRKVINLDSEDYDTITTGAAGACLQFHRIPAGRTPAPGGFLGFRFLFAAHLAFLLFDHALDHVAADIAGLAGRQIAVVALLQVDAQLAGDLILHVVQGGAGFGHVGAVGVAGGRRGTVISVEHSNSLLFFLLIESS